MRLREGLACQDRSHAFLEPSRIEIEECATEDEIRAYVRAVIDGEMRYRNSEGFQDSRVHSNKLGTLRLAIRLAKDPNPLERIPDAVLKRI